jgi:hypothetical protein
MDAPRGPGAVPAESLVQVRPRRGLREVRRHRLRRSKCSCARSLATSSLQVIFQEAEIGRREGSVFAIDDVSKCGHHRTSLSIVTWGARLRRDMGRQGRRGGLWCRTGKKIAGRGKKGRGVLGGVPALPAALTRAQRIGEKVSRVGFRIGRALTDRERRSPRSSASLIARLKAETRHYRGRAR